MEQEITPRQVGLKYGLITGLGYTAYSLTLFLTHAFANRSLGWLSYLILIAGLVLACREFKAGFYNTMTFKQGTSVGFWVVLISTLISTIFTYIYIEFDKELLEYMREQAMFELDKQHLSDEQVEQAMKMMDWFLSPEFLAGSTLIGGFIVGMIMALIVAAIMKKEPESF
ncbi:MAG: DUF4199 domain-containing protein [Thermoflexibacter sp.]|jgi:hypothetical protein|nr:DUF4199 domain-containing protein [Thermoflexibacter sp.]